VAVGLEFIHLLKIQSTRMEKFIIQDLEVTNCTGWMKEFSVKDGYSHVQMVRFWRMRMKQIRQIYQIKSYGSI